MRWVATDQLIAMNLFYAPDIKSNTYILPEEESKHVIRVLRLSTGDIIHLTDGLGGYYTAAIATDHPKRCELIITDFTPEFGKRNYSVSIAIAPIKNIDRFEWFLEKSTEIGIDHIYPVICARSERRIIKPDRLNRVITSAMKQSMKAYHPVLHEQLDFRSFILEKYPSARFIAHCGNSPKTLLKDEIKPGGENIILIGPEGDFTPEELEAAYSKGFSPVSLGESRLRTETAGVIACHTVALINQ
jgi:16S rRNA (uracil1498-N3)-methyltransferase